VLILVAAVTAGFWLNLIMWIPMLLIGRFGDDSAGDATALVFLLMQVVGAAAVFLFGLLVIGLPWYAAAIAGLGVGLTSYARPSPGHPENYGY
jgi:hypothetical protein